MNFVWSPHAMKRREEIFDYIAADNADAALWLDLKFSQAAEQLATFPLSGRKCPVDGVRMLIVHTNYQVLYEISDNMLVILTIHHSARNYALEGKPCCKA